jgi:cell division protein FtsI (penicillin-binding protein 3)
MSRKSPFSKLSMRIVGEKSSALDLARGRIVLIVAMFVMIYFVVAARLVDATLIQGYFRQNTEVSELDTARLKKQPAQLRRADIVDRNGVLLATSLKTASLHADPKIILDPVGTASALVKIFPELTYGETLRKLQDQKRFVWIKRNLTPEEQKKILEIGDPGLGFDYDFRRFYPQGPLTSHMVGYSDVDGRGLAGIERSFNKILSTEDAPITLTLDIRLQHILRREIKETMRNFTAKAAAGIIMDANTGEVMAAVSLPDFDPQSPTAKPNDPEMFNRVSLGVFEMGSLFKIFTTAALLEKTQTPMNKTYETLKPLQRYGRKISDFHPEKHNLSVPEIFMHSSNIGTALMAENIGTAGLQSFLRDLGLTKKEDFEINEVGTPILPNPWREINTLTISYGHGIAVTPLQVVTATSSILNGGLLVKPKLVKTPEPINEAARIRVVRKETSLKMRQLMRLVVTDGTGGNSNVPGYMVGGKTGTADKNEGGRYVKNKRISSFLGVFPVNDPKYVILVMVDEPQGNKKSHGYATAGWVAAPVVKKVISSMAPLLNMEPVSGQPELAEPLRQFVSVKARD